MPFVCPDWAEHYWKIEECVIHKNTHGTFSVVDHSLNGVEIFNGTEQECRTFMGRYAVTTKELQS